MNITKNRYRVSSLKQWTCLTLVAFFMFTIVAPTYAEIRRYRQSNEISSYHLRTQLRLMEESSPAEKAQFQKRISTHFNLKERNDDDIFSITDLNKKYETTHRFFQYLLNQIEMGMASLKNHIVPFLKSNIGKIFFASAALYAISSLFHHATPDFVSFLFSGILQVASFSGQTQGSAKASKGLVREYHVGRPHTLVSLRYTPEDIMYRNDDKKIRSEVVFEANFEEEFNAHLESLKEASSNPREVKAALEAARSLLWLMHYATSISYPMMRRIESLEYEIKKALKEKRWVGIQKDLLLRSVTLLEPYASFFGHSINRAQSNILYELRFISTLDKRLAVLMVNDPNFKIEIVLNNSSPVVFDLERSILKIDLAELNKKISSTKPDKKHKYLSYDHFFEAMVHLEISRAVAALAIAEVRGSESKKAWKEDEEKFVADLLAILSESEKMNKNAQTGKSRKHENEINSWRRDSILGFLKETGGTHFSLLIRQLSHLGKSSIEEKFEKIYTYLLRRRGAYGSSIPSLKRAFSLIESANLLDRIKRLEKEMDRQFSSWDSKKPIIIPPVSPETPPEPPITPPEPQRTLPDEEGEYLKEIERSNDDSISEYSPSFEKPRPEEENSRGNGDFSKSQIRERRVTEETTYDPAPSKHYDIAKWEEELHRELERVLTLSEKEQIEFFLGKALPKYFLVYSNKSSHFVRFRVKGLVTYILNRIVHGKGKEAQTFSDVVLQLMDGHLTEEKVRQLGREFRNSPYLYGLALFLGVDMISLLSRGKHNEILYGMAHPISSSWGFKVFNHGINERMLPIHFLGERLDKLNRDLEAYGFTYFGDIFGVVVKGEIKRFVTKNIMPILLGKSYLDRDPHPLTFLVAQSYRNDFEGNQQDQIEERMEQLVALHEMQHTVDELLGDLQRKKMTMVETETSAYLASIALSDAPYTSLVKVILLNTSIFASIFAPSHFAASERILKEFYTTLGLEQNVAMRPLDRAALLLDRVLKLSPSQLKSEARKIHSRLFGSNALARLIPQGETDLEDSLIVPKPVILPNPPEPQPQQTVQREEVKSSEREELAVSVLQKINLIRGILDAFLIIPLIRFLQMLISRMLWWLVAVIFIVAGFYTYAPLFHFPTPTQTPIHTSTPKLPFNIIQPDFEFDIKSLMNELPKDILHKTGKGESLSEISARYYGNPWDYGLVFEANRTRFKYEWYSPGIYQDHKSPLPYPSKGQKILVPQAKLPYYYRVKRGETLEEIARRYYGDRSEMAEILFIANFSRISDKENRALKTGHILILPAEGLKELSDLKRKNPKKPLGSIFYPFYLKGRIERPINIGEKIHNILYQLGEPKAAAPSLEELLFRMVPLSLNHTTLSSLAAFDPVGIGVVLGISIGLFAFAHMIVHWIVQAHENGWNRGILLWKYGSKKDLLVFIPSTIFTLLYLISFEFLPFSSPIFSHLFSYVIVVFAHSAYNIALLKDWIPQWLALGLLSQKEETLEEKMDSVVKKNLSSHFSFVAYLIQKFSLTADSKLKRTPIHLIDLQASMTVGEDSFDLTPEAHAWGEALAASLKMHPSEGEQLAPIAGIIFKSDQKEKILPILKEKWGIEGDLEILVAESPQEAIGQAQKRGGRIVSLFTERPLEWGREFIQWIVTLGTGNELRVKGKELKLLKRALQGSLGSENSHFSIEDGELRIPKETLDLNQTEMNYRKNLHFAFAA